MLYKGTQLKLICVVYAQYFWSVDGFKCFCKVSEMYELYYYCGQKVIKRSSSFLSLLFQTFIFSMVSLKL
uniref:Uncharacterized protein n=1 Tax=Anguilla anguilla TaxID=7936 RepID=A0A0E9X4S9_ANGAN